jgi:hypothetical protein
MGAALTYARRHALFALVGIAGEDDLDAPDLSLTPVPDKTPDESANHVMAPPGSPLPAAADAPWRAATKRGAATGRAAAAATSPEASNALA